MCIWLFFFFWQNEFKQTGGISSGKQTVVRDEIDTDNRRHLSRYPCWWSARALRVRVRVRALLYVRNARVGTREGGWSIKHDYNGGDEPGTWTEFTQRTLHMFVYREISPVPVTCRVRSTNRRRPSVRKTCTRECLDGKYVKSEDRMAGGGGWCTEKRLSRAPS